MKKIVILFSLLVGAFISAQAQELRTIPTNIVKVLPDGWHKFQEKGVTFDVEISQGSLVKGNIKWLDNTTYSGSFSNNVIGGRGTYTWPNGDRYEGSFRGNARSGKGTMYWTNGEKYSGKWKNDKKNGKGKMWDTNGTLEQGLWAENVLVKRK